MMILRYRALSVIIALLIALAFSPRAAFSQQAPLSPQDEQMIREVIQGQLAAFQRDDGNAAFSYAAPSIQSLFQTPARFMEMVKRDYQPVYRPKSAKFLDLIQRQGEVIQKMFIIGPKGVLVNAFYIMERQKNNVWKIGGCVLVPLKGETI